MAAERLFLRGKREDCKSYNESEQLRKKSFCFPERRRRRRRTRRPVNQLIPAQLMREELRRRALFFFFPHPDIHTLFLDNVPPYI